MKKCILSILTLIAAGAGALGQTGSVITSEFIVNSGTAPVLISGSTKAAGTLTLNVNPSPGDVITLGTFSYTYKSSISGTTNQILIGSGSLASTITNTINAIATGGTSNPNYYTSGSNTSATAVAGTGNSIAVTALSSGTAGNGVAATGSFASSYNTWAAATLTGGAVASGTDTIFTLPANGGSYVFTGADIVCLGGTLTAVPSVAIQSGSTTVLSGTVSLTGTTANNITHITAATSPLPVVVSGTGAAPIQLKITSSGTATSPFMGKVFIKGYWLALP